MSILPYAPTSPLARNYVLKRNASIPKPSLQYKVLWSDIPKHLMHIPIKFPTVLAEGVQKVPRILKTLNTISKTEELTSLNFQYFVL